MSYILNSFILRRKAVVLFIFFHEDMFKYINLKDKENRERAIKLVRETEEMAIHTQEPICITKKRADELIYKASDHLRMLELMLENDDKPESPYYNWLENE